MTSTRHAFAPKHPRVTAALDTVIAVVAVVLTPAVEWIDDHIAEPLAIRFAAWRKDRTGWEKTAAALRISIALGMLIGAIIALAGCRSEGEIPGHGIEPAAVRIADGLELTPEQMAEMLQVNPEGLAVLLSRTGR